MVYQYRAVSMLTRDKNETNNLALCGVVTDDGRRYYGCVVPYRAYVNLNSGLVYSVAPLKCDSSFRRISQSSRGGLYHLNMPFICDNWSRTYVGYCRLHKRLVYYSAIDSSSFIRSHRLLIDRIASLL